MLVYSTSSLVLVGPEAEPVETDEVLTNDELEEEELELVLCVELEVLLVLADLVAKNTAPTPATITIIITMTTATILEMASRL